MFVVDILRVLQEGFGDPNTVLARCWCGWWKRDGWGANRGGDSIRIDLLASF